jgi:protease II
MLEEPFLFEGAAVHNPICDLVNHLLVDDLSPSNREFGNIRRSQDVYDRIQRYSPYHMYMPEKPVTDLLISVDEELGHERYHARKFTSKLRDIFHQDPMYAFYREFSQKMYSEEQKKAEQYSFLINSLMYNH